jgi:catechol 2,3-dioxygenase-like lactoylglutathione lyase family enzyme
MRFVNPIPFVRDIDRSRAFYREVMQLEIRADHGNFVLFEGGFAIHEGQSLEKTIWKQNDDDTPAAYGCRNLLLSFETDDLDAEFARIAPQVELIHPVETQAWGQKVFRFTDPDGHAVEVGEPLPL